MNYRARAVAISTVGFMCLAIAGWMFSMIGAGWYSPVYSEAILVPLVAVLAVMGILAFVANRGLDAAIFFGGAGMLGSIAAYLSILRFTHLAEPITYVAWYAFMWVVYFGCVWAGSFRSGPSRSAFLGLLTLTLLLLSIGGWTGVSGWLMAGGYVGLITSIAAFVTAGAEIVRFGRLGNLNYVELTGTGTGTARPIAAD